MFVFLVVTAFRNNIEALQKISKEDNKIAL